MVLYPSRWTPPPSWWCARDRSGCAPSRGARCPWYPPAPSAGRRRRQDRGTRQRPPRGRNGRARAARRRDARSRPVGRRWIQRMEGNGRPGGAAAAQAAMAGGVAPAAEAQSRRSRARRSGARRSALGARRSALGARRSALLIRQRASNHFARIDPIAVPPLEPARSDDAPPPARLRAGAGLARARWPVHKSVHCGRSGAIGQDMGGHVKTLFR